MHLRICRPYSCMEYSYTSTTHAVAIANEATGNSGLSKGGWTNDSFDASGRIFGIFGIFGINASSGLEGHSLTHWRKEPTLQPPNFIIRQDDKAMLPQPDRCRALHQTPLQGIAHKAER